MADSIVLTALTTIYEQRGALTPAAVVEVASAPDHPLHSRFEWDDAEAARDFRLLQAGQLIRSVRLKITEPEVTEVRAFLHVPGTEAGAAGSYVPETEVRHDPVLQAVILQQMNREWRILKRRYENHAAFWGLVQDELSAAVGG